MTAPTDPMRAALPLCETDGGCPQDDICGYRGRCMFFGPRVTIAALAPAAPADDPHSDLVRRLLALADGHDHGYALTKRLRESSRELVLAAASLTLHEASVIAARRAAEELADRHDVVAAIRALAEGLDK